MTKTKATDLSFEDALAKLESIVDAMESGDVPLADLLAKYEQGTTLLQVCESRLKDAEIRIEQLKQQKDGSSRFTAFETTESES
jgi:exodeoxyribonuclease VII small subunit